MEQEPEFIREKREIQFLRGQINGLANEAANCIFELAQQMAPAARNEFLKSRRTLSPRFRPELDGDKSLSTEDRDLLLYNRGSWQGANDLRSQLNFRIEQVNQKPDEE